MAKKKNDMKQGFGKVSEDAKQQAFERAKEQGSADFDEGALFKIQDGLNVIWFLPPFGTQEHFFERVKLHYGPMHICGRGPKAPDPTDPEKTTDDKNFRNCYRCIEAWNAYEAAGKPGTKDQQNQNPVKDHFKSNLSSDQSLVQGIDLTPFFTGKGVEPKLDDRYAPLLKEYLEIMVIEDDDEREAAAEALADNFADEKMAERVANSAAAGVSVLRLNYETTNSLEDTEAEVRRKWRKRKGLPDELAEVVKNGPLNHPEHFLAWIERRNGEETFKSRGQQRTKKVYNIKFLTPDDLDDGWTGHVIDNDLLPLLWGVAQEGAIDMRQPVFDADATLEDRARGFARLEDTEMAEYLEESDHSFEYSSSDDTEDDLKDDGNFDMSNPASFGPVDSVHSDADASDAIARARERRRAEKSEEPAEA